jgi:hypothetical protein
MNWSEEEFIRDSADAEPLPPVELTGWETVRFEVDDELPQE